MWHLESPYIYGIIHSWVRLGYTSQMDTIILWFLIISFRENKYSNKTLVVVMSSLSWCVLHIHLYASARFPHIWETWAGYADRYCSLTVWFQPVMYEAVHVWALGPWQDNYFISPIGLCWSPGPSCFLLCYPQYTGSPTTALCAL